MKKMRTCPSSLLSRERAKLQDLPFIEAFGGRSIRQLSGLEVVEEIVHAIGRSCAVRNHSRQLLSVEFTHTMGIVSRTRVEDESMQTRFSIFAFFGPSETFLKKVERVRMNIISTTIRIPTNNNCIHDV